ncbi:hypothetical protein CFP56_022885 [Quercus suber]|uniref:Uncharacterized protein n=1 Tax=Quercus suber TaxID=58331 RepID=A0AAW0KEA6_QUESU
MSLCFARSLKFSHGQASACPNTTISIGASQQHDAANFGVPSLLMSFVSSVLLTSFYFCFFTAPRLLFKKLTSTGMQKSVLEQLSDQNPVFSKVDWSSGLSGKTVLCLKL